MHSTLSANTYYDVKAIKVHEMVQNIKIWVCQEREVTFSENENLS